MLQANYSRHSPGFMRRLKKLAAAFGEHRSAVLRHAFTRLPWEDLAALSHFKLPKKIKTIVIVGIGGSSLGAKTILSALSVSKIAVCFLDNVDPDFVHERLATLDLKSSFFLLISKSGETIEVLSLAAILISKISTASNFLIITDASSSPLARFGMQHKIQLLQSPHNIPGRFSALSVVALLPALLTGIPIRKVQNGAGAASWKKAYELACYQYLHSIHKKPMTVIFPYGERLSNFADWYIQLLAESIGKSKLVGITPIKALGVKDQHSQLQLFLDGPDDKFFIFIKPQHPASDIKIPGKRFSMSELFTAEYEGVKKAFSERKKSFLELSFTAITPEALGELLFFFELEIAFLGSLFKVNPENQPAVELSKRATQSILAI